eukprot:GFYU01002075.1.p1 GENE.GFYU01002075.1~~GFYU01002075.1.p1  ORF type:complete len:269 (+),score=65.33 GFYU01002075.1:361-1167(+)
MPLAGFLRRKSSLSHSMSQMKLSRQESAGLGADDPKHFRCPFAQSDTALTQEVISGCPIAHHAHSTVPKSAITGSVPVAVRMGSHQTSAEQARLLKDIGGGDRIRELATRFYSKAFKDVVLSKFMFEEDGAVAHGKRLADWIIQKMGGEGTPWDDSGRHGMRQPSHHAAWNSVKREPEKRGQHFQLDDCRIWMRLMFWACRDVGLAENKAFMQWYTKFLGHFIAVYERTAPPYAEESREWSADPDNIKKYLDNGREMKDVIGVRASRW